MKLLPDGTIRLTVRQVELSWALIQISWLFRTPHQEKVFRKLLCC